MYKINEPYLCKVLLQDLTIRVWDNVINTFHFIAFIKIKYPGFNAIDILNKETLKVKYHISGSSHIKIPTKYFWYDHSRFAKYFDEPHSAQHLKNPKPAKPNNL